MMKPSFALSFLWLFFAALTPAWAQTAGGACTLENQSTPFSLVNRLQYLGCISGLWQMMPLQAGTYAVTCNAGAAGTIKWTGTKIQYCNGTAWTDFADAAGGPKFYVTATGYNGSAADTACAAGYHMCYAGEWAGRSVDTTRNGLWGGGMWYGNNSNQSATDCLNWTSASSSDRGSYAAVTNQGSSIFGWVTGGHFACNSAFKVLCCSD